MRTGLSLLAALATLPLFAGETTVRERPYVGWGSDRLMFNRGALVAGDANRYGFNLLMTKPDRRGETRTYFCMTEPRRMFGFGQNGVDFLDLVVNGIPLAKLVPDDTSFQTWARDGRAGVDALLNFDGCRIVVEASMEPGSPLLFLSVRTAEGGESPLESCRVRIRCVPSAMNVENGRHVGYRRFAKTAVRELKTTDDRDRRHALRAEDCYVVLGDEKLDGSGPGKGYGPSYVLLPDDFTAVKQVELLLPNGYENAVEIDMKPGFDKIAFAVLQTPEAVSNDEFFKRFAGSIPLSPAGETQVEGQHVEE